jgi:hypothetical protein
MLALVLGMVCVQSAPAQTFKRVKVKGGAALTQIAAGGASVWARSSSGHPYILKGKQFVLANSIFLCQIAVGAGNAFQADAVWGLDCSGNIYSATKSGASWVFSRAPGVLDFIAVGPGYKDNCHPYEVWGLSSTLIYRYNFCIQNWDNVPGSLATLAVGSNGRVWGINGAGALFEFIFETLRFSQPSGLGGFVATQVAVGTNGVWVLDDQSSLYMFVDGFGLKLAIGGSIAQVQVGGNGVWEINPSGAVIRYENLQYFDVIPGTLVSISVGSGAGVWGLDSSGKAYAFSTP